MTVKAKLIVAGIVLLAVLFAALWLRFGAAAHEQTRFVVNDRADRIESLIERRHDALDKKVERLDAKLDTIESKLDKLLNIANRPLPDNLRTAD